MKLLAENETFLTENTQDRKRFITQSKHMILDKIKIPET